MDRPGRELALSKNNSKRPILTVKDHVVIEWLRKRPSPYVYKVPLIWAE